MLPIHLHRNSSPDLHKEKYAKYPETIVMEVQDAYTNFVDVVCDTTQIEVYIGEALEEVMAHISDQGMIDHALDILADHTTYNHLINNCSEDGIIIAVAMTNLGKALYRTLAIIGAYDDKGALPYKYSHYDDNGNIYLIKDLTYV